MDNFNQDSDMIPVDENQMMEKEPRRFKWWILLIILGVIVFLFIAVILIAVGIFAGITIFGAQRTYNNYAYSAPAATSYSSTAPTSTALPSIDTDEEEKEDSTASSGKKPTPDDFTVSDYDSLLNDALNNPDEVNNGSAPIPSTANSYDYTIVNDAYGRDKTKVETWIKKYYPDCTVTKEPNSGFEYWKLTSDLPLKDLSVGGYIFSYDYVCIDFDENDCVKTVGFYRSCSDKDEFDKVRQAFTVKYGFETVSNMFDSDMGDKFSLEYYIWEYFDNYSDLYICRTFGDSNPNPEIGLTISKHKN